MTDTLREDLLPLVADARSEIVDTVGGLRRFDVYVRRRVPSDGRYGAGATIAVTDTKLTERPRIRIASPRDELRSGGRVKAGMYVMDKITPRDDAGTVGLPPGTIDLSPSQPAEQVKIVLVGPDMPAYVPANPPSVPYPSGGGEFNIVASDTSKNFGFWFGLAPSTGRQAT